MISAGLCHFKSVRCDRAVDYEGSSLCVLSQLKPSEFYILSFEKGLGFENVQRLQARS